MIRYLVILLLFVSAAANAAITEFSPGTNAMIISTYDSFDQGPAGNGHFCWDEAFIALVNPSNMYRFRYASQSGKNNNELLTNNLPAVGMPLIGSMAGTNEVFMWDAASGNGGQIGNSNYYYTNIQGELEFPYLSWTRDGRVTNDFPWTTNNLHWRVFGDSTYLGDTNGNFNPTTGPAFYSNVASNTASLSGIPFVDSVFHTIFECAIYTQQGLLVASNLFYPVNQPPDFIQASHPGKWDMQGVRHILDLIQMGAPTNVWSCYADWSTGTIPLTNSFAAGTVTKTANVLSFPGKALRLGPPVEIPDGFHTNDIRHSFISVPACSNAFNELLVVSNLPAGSWITYIGSSPVFTNTVPTNGTVSNNFYHSYTGPWYWQKMAVLNTTRKVRDINTNDASSISGQVYMRNFGSFSGIVWPTNNGAAGYTSAMLAQEKTMEAVDLEGFNAAQPVTQTITLSNASYVPPTAYVGTVKAGIVHWGQ